jgi:hypothetical protein
MREYVSGIFINLLGFASQEKYFGSEFVPAKKKRKMI